MAVSILQRWAKNFEQVAPDYLRMATNGSTPVSDKVPILSVPPCGCAGIDFEQAFETIRCPLLLQADPAKQIALLDVDLELIQAQVPAAQRVFFPGVGHGIHVEQPQKVAQMFEGFIDQSGS